MIVDDDFVDEDFQSTFQCEIWGGGEKEKRQEKYAAGWLCGRVASCHHNRYTPFGFFSFSPLFNFVPDILRTYDMYDTYVLRGF